MVKHPKCSKCSSSLRRALGKLTRRVSKKSDRVFHVQLLPPLPIAYTARPELERAEAQWRAIPTVRHLRNLQCAGSRIRTRKGIDYNAPASTEKRADVPTIPPSPQWYEMMAGIRSAVSSNVLCAKRISQPPFCLFCCVGAERRAAARGARKLTKDAAQ